MKTRLENFRVTTSWLAIFCCLLFPGLLSAQDTDVQDKGAQVQKEKATNAPADSVAAEAPETVTASDDTSESERHVRVRDRNGVNRNALVQIGHDVWLKEGETADAVVVIGGSARISGIVHDAVVVVGGDLDVEGEIGDAAVAVMGNVRANEGGKIKGEIVAVGGRADIAKGARVHGHIQEVDFGGLPHAEWLRKWFSKGVVKLRPLPPGVGWVWGAWGVFLVIYLLIAVCFPRAVQACVNEITRRPATSFLMGLLTKLLLPLVLVILVAIVIGIIAAPFVIAALIVGLLVGKTAIMEWLGFQARRQFGNHTVGNPVGAFFVGAVIITLLYMVPVLGLITFLFISVWGLGGAVMAAFAGLRRELPGKATIPDADTPPEPTPTPPIAPSAGGFGTTPAAAPAAAFQRAQPEHVVPPTTTAAPEPPPASATASPDFLPGIGGAAAIASPPEAWAYPKASFWERMGAAFLDVVLVSILGGVVGGPPQAFLVALAYFAGMWTWKGTTIGGIVLGLKVARVDAQPITFTIALVRALAAAFSAIVLFLGFLWILWDKDRQGWHDRIAGTVVVKLPKGTPLVCL